MLAIYISRLPVGEWRLEVAAKFRQGVVVFRGVRPQTREGFASDPGDFGRGRYWTTSESRAKCYGVVTTSTICLQNPLVLEVDEAYALADMFETVKLKRKGISRDESVSIRVANAQRLTDGLRSMDYDGLVAIRHYTLGGEMFAEIEVCEFGDPQE